MIILKDKKCSSVIFGLGAMGYGAIELIWRGRTHWSMLAAGGLSFLTLSKISNVFKKASLFTKAIIGSAFITAIEYIFGLIFNIILKRNVWDYSEMPLNINGQVCPLYSFFWLLLSFLFIPLADKIRNKMR